MKKKIKVIGIDGKTLEKEYNTRNYEMYQESLKHKSQTFRDKTKYTRKEKYKKRISNDPLYFFIYSKKSLKNILLI